jgi:pilus assembly protein CpaC
MVVSPEVSDLDYSRAISYSGFLIPAIDTRRMSTVVELKDNQSFAIAGLLKNNVRESVKKFPVLGDIPILGALFRSTKYQKDETELVVIVTPHLVKPINADEFPLPTDSFEDPTPFEFLLLGRLEKWRDPNAEGDNSPAGGGSTPVMDGDFGYITPE